MDIKRVNIHNNPLSDKVVSAGEKTFKLWLEFENTSLWEDPTNDFANIQVDLLDGRLYGIAICTFKNFQTWIDEQSKQQNVDYEIPVDLYVKELTRDCIERTISELLGQGDLEDLLNESVFGLHYLDPWKDILEMEDAGTSIEEKLSTGLHDEHILANKKFDVLAIRQDNDDILIEFENKELAVIHWSENQSKEHRKHPSIRTFKNSKDFWLNHMKPDTNETACDSYLYFAFDADYFDTQKVTQALDVEPTSVKVKKEPVPKSTTWKYRMDAGDALDLESYLEKLISVFAPKTPIINTLKEKYGLTTRIQFVIDIDVHPESSTPYFGLNEKAIDFLSKTGTTVDFDLYKANSREILSHNEEK